MAILCDADLLLDSTVHPQIPRLAVETRNFGMTLYERRNLNRCQQIEIKHSPLLSIFAVRDDNKMNDLARKTMPLAPPEGEERGEEQ